MFRIPVFFIVDAETGAKATQILADHLSRTYNGPAYEDMGFPEVVLGTHVPAITEGVIEAASELAQPHFEGSRFLTE